MPTVGQRDARLRARTRPARTPDAAGVATYVPDDDLSRPHTLLLRALVTDIVPVDADDAGELLSALAGHTAWLVATGSDVTTTTLLDPDLVQRWVLVGFSGLSAGTTANYRSRIARVAAAADGTARRAALYASDPVCPYSRRDEDVLDVLAHGQRNDRLRDGFLVVVCTSLGAGLSTAEITDAHGTDVRQRPDGTVTVDVDGPRARTVPVRPRYADDLLDLARSAGDRPLFCPGSAGRLGKNAVTKLIGDAMHGSARSLPRLTPQRARATWIVRHLDAGVRPRRTHALRRRRRPRLVRPVPAVPHAPRRHPGARARHRGRRVTAARHLAVVPATPVGHTPPPHFRKRTKHDDRDVATCREVIRLSALVPFFERMVHRKTGRRLYGFTVEALLVGFLVAACDRRPLLFTEVSEVLHHRLTAKARADLGITRPRPFVSDDRDSLADKARALAEEENAVKQIERLFMRMLAPIDPSPLPKNRVVDPEVFRERTADMTGQEQDRRQDLLDWACNRLLEATWLMLPKPVRDSWDGSLAQDATYLKVFAAPPVSNPDGTPRWMSADADAGWYIRTGTHKADGTEGHTKIKFGVEAEIAVMGNPDPDAPARHPNLVIGATFKAPGIDPAGRALDVLRDIARRHLLVYPDTGLPFPDGTHPDGPAPARHPVGRHAADRAYSDSPAENWAIPLRTLGYPTVFDYDEKDYGLQGSDQGMLLVEGRWYSPSIPKALVEATIDYKVRKKIDEPLYRTRIKARKQYEIRQGKPDADGYRRMWCGAATTPSGSITAVVKCNRKTDSLAPHGPNDARPKMIPLDVAGAVPVIRKQKTVTLHPDTHAKHQQDLAYESEEWNAAYHTLRNGVEGKNAQLKDTAGNGFEDAWRRRVRGIAPTSLLATFMIAANNIDRIIAFYKVAETLPNGSMAVLGPKKARARRRVHTLLDDADGNRPPRRNDPDRPAAKKTRKQDKQLAEQKQIDLRRRSARARRETQQ